VIHRGSQESAQAPRQTKSTPRCHSKELIKVRGSQIAPLELGAVLLDAKDRIVDIAVIGLKPKPGSDAKRPRAYIVRKPNTHITEEEVHDLVGDKLADYSN